MKIGGDIRDFFLFYVSARLTFNSLEFSNHNGNLSMQATKFYKLRNKEAPWGDYGDILLSGMTHHREREDGVLQLERAGPFVPPLIISGVWDLIVTDEVKRKLELSNLAEICFKSVMKKRIVHIDWTNWDMSEEDPLFYPESGEPEDYILGNSHSEELSAQIGPLWEVIVPKAGFFNDEGQYVPGTMVLDICMAENAGYLLTSEKARLWIEQHAGDWVEFFD